VPGQNSTGIPGQNSTGADTQLRLCARFHRLAARGLNRNKTVVAVARELAGFVWAIAQQVKPL
jgi:hypothetical protein